MLVEHDQVVEHPHDGQFGVGELLEHRQARYALGFLYPKRAAALLRRRHTARQDREHERTRRDGGNRQLAPHWIAPPYLSSQMSSRRLPLKMLLTMSVKPLT